MLKARTSKRARDYTLPSLSRQCFSTGISGFPLPGPVLVDHTVVVSLGAAVPLPSNMSVVSMFVCVGEKRKGKEKIVYGNYVELQIRSFTWLIDIGR